MKMYSVSNNIPIEYETSDVKVSFEVEFGKAKNACDYPESSRVNYETPYTVENYEQDGKKSYRIQAEEGAFAIKVSKVNVVPKKDYNRKDYLRKYGLCVIVDMNEKPEYFNQVSLGQINDTKRDGGSWMIYNGKTLKVDQNSHAKYQWSVAKALEKGVEPTEDQIMKGVEKRHENSGMVYVTFHPSYTEEYIGKDDDEEEEVVYRGFGGVTRGGSGNITRGLNMDTLMRGMSDRPSKAARVGMGYQAKTTGTNCVVRNIEYSRYVLPVRFRVTDETFENDIRCCKDFESAKRLDELQKNTGQCPDDD